MKVHSRREPLQGEIFKPVLRLRREERSDMPRKLVKNFNGRDSSQFFLL
jgi:hypothetical protein